MGRGRAGERLAAALLVLVIGAASRAGGAPEEFHNYLERWNVGGVSVLHPVLPRAGLDFGGGAAAPRLSLNASALTASGQWIEVALAGVPSPAAGDLVAVYAVGPGGVDYTAAAPVKYVAVAAADAGYLATGAARLPLRVVNLRVDLAFVLVRGGLEAPVVQPAAGAVLRNAAPNEPTGAHLLVGGRPGEARVQWATRDAGSPVVRYGLAPGRYNFTAAATTATYARGDLCGPPATAQGWLPPGSLHTAAMTGLPLGARVYYVVGDEQSGDFTEERYFWSHPGVGPGTSFRALVLADQGVGEPDGSQAEAQYQVGLDVARRMAADVSAAHGDAARRFELVLHPGDISYARGYAALWDTFFLQQGPVASRVPMAVAVGNHERDWPGTGGRYDITDSGGECGVPYAKRFPSPDAGAGPDQPWYALEFGPVHFTVMSTEHAFERGSPQYEWLAADLAGVDRARTPWLVLVGHRPIYVDADDLKDRVGKQTTALQLQAALEDLLRSARVDVAIAGHHHSFQRTCAVYKKRCAPGAPVYVTLGNAGANFYNNGFDPTPEWAASVFMLTHGHSRLEVNGTALRLEAVDVETGEVFDTLTLTKPAVQGAGGPPVAAASEGGAAGAPVAAVADGPAAAATSGARAAGPRLWPWRGAAAAA